MAVISVLTGISSPVTCSASADAPLIVQVWPAVAGAPVTFDGETRWSDQAGVVVFASVVGSARGRLSAGDFDLDRDGRRVHFVADRVLDDRPKPLITYDSFFDVTLVFTDSENRLVDNRDITDVKLKSSVGEVFSYVPGSTLSVHGERQVTTSSGFVTKRLQLAIMRVTVAGSNVVNVGQQRFEPADTGQFTARLLFNAVSIRAHDAVFGSRVGSAALLRFPDGSVRRLPFGKDGWARVDRVPRGDYSVAVDGPGPLLWQPLAISREQELDLKFYTWLDLGAAAALGLMFLGVTTSYAVRSKRRHRLVATSSVVES